MTSPFAPVLRRVEERLLIVRPPVVWRPARVEVEVVKSRAAAIPPTKVLVAVEVATKYFAPIVGASIPPEKVEVPEAPTAIATVVVGASKPPALISHDLPNKEVAAR